MSRISETTGADWAGMAKLYKSLTTGVASRPIATILEKSNALLPFAEATAIHDNGCGPGLVLGTLIDKYGSSLPKTCHLSASDFSEAMVEQVKTFKAEKSSADPDSPWARVEASVLDAMDLKGVPDGSKSHVTAGWVYFMTPNPRKCLTETHRVLQPGGVLGLSSWQDSDWMRIMNLAATVRPGLKPFEIPQEWKYTEPLARELEETGFRDVESVEVPVEMTFESYAELADMFLTKMPQIVNMIKDFTVEERAKLEEMTMDAIKKAAPTEPGHMKGVALVAVGRK